MVSDEAVGGMIMRQETRPCPVTGVDGKNLTVIGSTPTSRKLQNGPQYYDFIYCEKSDLYYLSLLPDQQVFAEIYSGIKWQPLKGERAEIQKTYYRNRLIAIIKDLAIKTQPMRILEVGCGYAWVSSAAKDLDSSIHTVGQDINPAAKEYCTWVDSYFVQSFEESFDQIRTLGPYDIISMTHVIEHLPYPTVTLRYLRDVLRANGIIFITTPYRPPRWKENMLPIEEWRAWQHFWVPGHLQYFSERSLSVAADFAGLQLSYFNNKCSGGEALEAWLRAK